MGTIVNHGRGLRLLAAAFFIGAAGFTSSSARASLLVNGDFNADADANGLPDGWTNWTANASGGGAFAAYNTSPTNTFTENGTPFVNAGNFGSWWAGFAGWYQVVPGTAGDSYTASVDSGTEGWDNVNAAMRLIYLDAGANVISYDEVNVANYQANKPWATYTGTFTAPAGTAQLKFEIADYTGSRGSAFFDNASLIDNTVSAPEPAGLGLIGLAASALLPRRRRRAGGVAAR